MRIAFALIGSLVAAGSCGGMYAGEGAAALTYSGSCRTGADGGVELAPDAGYFADRGIPGPAATADQLAGTWHVIAPICLSGSWTPNASGAGAWTCGTSGLGQQAAWTGKIEAKPDVEYTGGLVLWVQPDPSAWSYASGARVTYVSRNELHAVVGDGYWGYPGAVMYFCREP